MLLVYGHNKRIKRVGVMQEDFKCSNKECIDCVDGYCVKEKLTCMGFYPRDNTKKEHLFPFG